MLPNKFTLDLLLIIIMVMMGGVTIMSIGFDLGTDITKKDIIENQMFEYKGKFYNFKYQNNNSVKSVETFIPILENRSRTKEECAPKKVDEWDGTIPDQYGCF